MRKFIIFKKKKKEKKPINDTSTNENLHTTESVSEEDEITKELEDAISSNITRLEMLQEISITSEEEIINLLSFICAMDHLLRKTGIYTAKEFNKIQKEYLQTQVFKDLTKNADFHKKLLSDESSSIEDMNEDEFQEFLNETL